jgi:hypothetical protein
VLACMHLGGQTNTHHQSTAATLCCEPSQTDARVQGVTTGGLHHQHRVLACQPVGEHGVITGCEGGSLHIWDTRKTSSAVSSSSQAHSSRIRAICTNLTLPKQAISSSFFATASSDGLVKVWDYDTIANNGDAAAAAVADLGARFTCMCSVTHDAAPIASAGGGHRQQKGGNVGSKRPRADPLQGELLPCEGRVQWSGAVPPCTADARSADKCGEKGKRARDMAAPRATKMSAGTAHEEGNTSGVAVTHVKRKKMALVASQQQDAGAAGGERPRKRGREKVAKGVAGPRVKQKKGGGG